MDICNRRVRAYKNGKILEQCKETAESKITDFKKHIEDNGKLLWSEILNQVDHDELTHKFTLKFLRRGGYDLGIYKYLKLKNSLTSICFTTTICIS